MPIVRSRSAGARLCAAAVAVRATSAAPRSTRISRRCGGTSPQLWNGRMLLLRRACDRPARVLRGSFFETDFASFVAWRDWGFPDPACATASRMGALRGARRRLPARRDGRRTRSMPARSTFPAGTPDPDDIVGGTVDLAGNVRARGRRGDRARPPTTTRPTTGWYACATGPRIAMMKLLRRARDRRRVCARASSRISRASRSPSLPTSASCAVPPISIR